MENLTEFQQVCKQRYQSLDHNNFTVFVPTEYALSAGYLAIYMDNDEAITHMSELVESGESELFNVYQYQSGEMVDLSHYPVSIFSVEKQGDKLASVVTWYAEKHGLQMSIISDQSENDNMPSYTLKVYENGVVAWAIPISMKFALKS